MKKKVIKEIQSSEGTSDTLAEIKRIFMHSEDFILKKHFFMGKAVTLVYFDSLVDRHYLDQYILSKLEDFPGESYIDKMMSAFQVEENTDQSLDDLSQSLLTGYVLFFLEGRIISIHAGSLAKRQPEESSLETSIRGPKDGFVEDLNTNISLIRRRLLTPSLCVEKYSIGKRARTEIAIMYLDDVIDERILDELHMRIKKIDVDVITGNQQVETLLDDNPYSIFTSFDYTGRPDFIVDTLNQGRFALLVDGFPTVSIAPVHLNLLIKSPEDTSTNYVYVSLERVVRIYGMVISAFLPGLWVAFSAYNIEQIPYLLVATISMSRFGLPLSAPVEMFIVLFLFEFFNEAGVRLPRAIGQTVSVLGGLIVGDAAIRAGLTSPTMLVIGAITYISSFTLVNQSLKYGTTVLRFLVLLVSTFFGLFGVVMIFILTVIYISSLTSFGVPYFATSAPISLMEAIKSYFRLPPQLYKKRTLSTSPDDLTRNGGLHNEKKNK
ncbi:spore germination protein [Rossellomorea aquimaris]|uniref:spore germination protein n=1 Tax=Rossellomorea aquimaris TaxID=189382 RepID=UPI001CD1FEE9|nr:spore germination protein [Rossellomorea aquimaris]MCA1053657.1 spore germination protein [Rossellomorea aquimaris]